MRTEISDLELGELVRGHRLESRVGVADRLRQVVHDFSERRVAFDSAKAAAQRAVEVNRDERPEEVVEDATTLDFRSRLATNQRFERAPGQTKQPLAFGVHEHARDPHQTAAAMYPTTEDLSPDTSPESR